MSNRSYVRDDDGNITHQRVTNDSGDRSWLFEQEDSVFGDGRGACVEVADHHDDGTTSAYEYEGSVFGDGKGAAK